MGRKTLAIVLMVSIVGCTLAMSKPDDAHILTRVGRLATNKVAEALPETSKMAGPVNALRGQDLVPVAERVRMRVQNDKSMDGATVAVIPDGDGVKLRGQVKNAAQRIRAVELAQSTAGVERVVNELVEPGQ